MIRRMLALALLAGASSLCVAQTMDVSILIDRSGGTSGCTVAGIPGVDARLSAQVDGASGQVDSLTLQSCLGGVFASPQVLSSGYPLGLNIGTGGADVVELSVSAAAVNAGGSANFSITALTDDGGMADQARGAFLGIVFPVPIAPWAVLVLALLLGGLALWAIRRHPAPAVLLVSLATFSAWAANFMLDGEIDDWAGVAPVADSIGDTGSNRADIVAVFTALENGQLWFRVDLVDVENLAPVAVDDAFATDEDTAITTGSVLANDTDADSDPLSVLSFDAAGTQGQLTDNGNGTFGYDPNGQFESLPQGASAIDVFAYTVSDGQGGTDSATVAITVNGVNDAPVASDDALSTAEDTPMSGNVLANDADVDVGDTLTVNTIPVTGPANGLVTLSADGGFTYTPSADFQGSDAFSYEISDDHGATAQAVVAIIVDSVNDAPLATADSGATDEDTVRNTAAPGVLGNDSDPEMDPLTVSAFDPASTNGALVTVNADGSYSYDPTAAPALQGLDDGESVTDTFGYTVSDGALVDTTTVTITVSGVNDAPVAPDDAFTTGEDTALNTGNVFADNGAGADFDVDGEPLSVASVNGNAGDVGASITLISGAQLQLNADGSFSYDPAGNFEDLNVGQQATDDFTYTISDGTDLSGTATVMLTIEGVNDAPVLVFPTADVNYAPGGPAVNIDPAATLTDVDSTSFDSIRISLFVGAGCDPLDGLTVQDQGGGAGQIGFDGTTVSFEGAAIGSLAQAYACPDPVDGATQDPFQIALTGPGASQAATEALLRALQFVSTSGDTSSRSISAQVSDGQALSSPAIQTVLFNRPPIAVDDGFTTDEDSAITTGDVRDNDSDPDGDPFTVLSFDATGTQGQVSDNGNGIFAYDPNGQFESLALGESGTDSFTYTIGDGIGGTDTATVTITVNGVNDAPTADGDTYSVNEGETLNVAAPGVLDGDSDAEGDSLTAVLVGGPANASAFTLNADGSFSYTHDGSETTSDSFTYRANDSALDSNLATVTITITPVNDEPVADDQNVTVVEDTPLLITLTATDPDTGDTLSFALGTGPSNGSLSGFDSATGEVTYTPNANFNGTDSFTFTVNDGTVTSAAGTVSLTVTEVNDPPVAGDDAASTDEDVALVIAEATLLANDSSGPANESTQTLSVSAVGTTSAQGGTVSVSGGNVTYTPPADFFGTDSFSYTVTDDGTTNGVADPQSTTGTVTITVNPVNDAPMATAKLHVTHSGIGLLIDAASHTGALKEGATDVDNTFAELSVALVGTPTPANATVSLVSAADGSFFFEPPGGLSGNGSASFQYRVCDNGNAGLGLAPACSGAVTVTFNVTGPDLWFVDDTDAAGCGATCNGSRSKPLVGLAALPGIATRGTGDRIFAFSGSYADGHSFAGNEHLIGQGASGTFDTVLGVTVPGNGTLDTRPSLGGAAPSIQNTINLAAGSNLRGVASATSGVTGISGGAVNGPIISETTVNAADAAALVLNGTTGVNMSFPTLSSSGSGTSGVSLTSVTGGITATGGTLSNASNADFLISGGTATVNYGGTISDATGTVVSVTGATAGTKTFSGPLGSGAISLTNNTGATVNFTGGMSLNTGGANAFSATGGGVVNVTGTNTLTTTTGTALNVQNTTIGASGLNFRSISADGGANGIVLVNTGATNGLRVTGNTTGNCGGDANPSPASASPYGTRTLPDASDCSGGTIQNMAGGDGSTAGIGVYLQNTSNVSLTRMRLSGSHQNYGIRGVGASNVTLDNVLMDGSFGNNLSIDEGAVAFTNLSGSASVTNSFFSGSVEHDFQVRNTSAVTLNRITVDNVVFGISTASGDHLLLTNDVAGTLNATVRNSRFMGAGGDMLQFIAQNGGISDLVVQNNVFFNQHASIASGGGGVNFGIGSTSSDPASLTYLVTGNRFRGASGVAFGVQKGVGTGSAVGSVTNNLIGDAAVANSGSAVGNGLYFNVAAQGKHKVLIDNNVVTQYNGFAGMSILAGGVPSTVGTRNGSMHATIRRNSFTNAGTNGTNYVDGILFEGGTNSGDAYTVCLNVGQGTGNANVLTGIRDATDGSGITGEEYSVIANNTGVMPADLWWKLLGYPIATHTPTDGTTVDNVLGSANGGVSGWTDAARSSSTYAGNGGFGAPCDLP